MGDSEEAVRQGNPGVMERGPDLCGGIGIEDSI